MEKEIWKYINGYEGLYKVSNMGNVKSCETKLITDGKEYLKKEFMLKPARKTVKYIYYGLYNIENNTYKLYSAHRLVAIHFIPNPENKSQVNHKFGNKFDNRASVLEWNTQKENINHAVALGLVKCGEDNKFSKLTNREAKEIRKKYIRNVYTLKMLSKEYRVSIKTIQNVLQNKHYTI